MSTKTNPVASLRNVSVRHGEVSALGNVTIDLPAGRLAGVIGPDGVGKSTLLALVAGVRAIQSGDVCVLDGDMADPRHRRTICPRIAYMPQGLGKNLYPTLSVAENIDFFGRLFGHGQHDRAVRTRRLADATGLAPFLDRPVGKLSGGMKQKLGLCCALIHDPDLLILDEPTTGVDPLSRRQFWDLIGEIREGRPGMSVLVATAYMEEAARFDWLVAMHAGGILASGTPADLLTHTGTATLEAAFVALLPEGATGVLSPADVRDRAPRSSDDVAIEATDLTMRYGSFTAVEKVNLRIRRGEIFGFLGSNGCGKTTTMKMLTGLLPPSEGSALLFGQPVDARDVEARRRVGYMSQSFSLYGELTIRQNLELHARLFRVARDPIPQRVDQMLERFGLVGVANSLPADLPLGHRQRLSLAVAMIHRPEILMLDEPTSGVDPLARDVFWRILTDLSQRDGVTIFVSTHYMNEAERCDRVSFMHAGRIIATDTPEELKRQRGAATLEDAFVSFLLEATGARADAGDPTGVAVPRETIASTRDATKAARPSRPFDLRRLASIAHRESLELRRDPIRLTLSLLGSLILLFVLGMGITMDVDHLRFAVLDRDQTATSQGYVLDIAGSRYFVETPQLDNYDELDRRMRAGEIALALEIPPGFARDVARGRPVSIGAWIDGAMPSRADTVRGYVEGIHRHWLATRARASGHADALIAPASVEVRYRYNPDVESLVAIVPATIPLLLMLIPAMLTALSVTREKELGSITNFYVTPTTRFEFLVGKQLPYLALSMVSFLLLTYAAVFVLGVPVKGSVGALTLAALLYLGAATAIGLVVSAFMRSQLAAIFGTSVITLLPAVNFSGLIDPVPSLEGLGRLIGEIYPTTHFVTIARGTFAKALGFSDLSHAFVALIFATPVLLVTAVSLLRKQEA